ncbi:MAG: hypothetical protein K0R45_3323 [Pseudomonas sp.]|jgi:hypothetical protein|nr:hypothetical protein [Pseudomonas sp.]
MSIDSSFDTAEHFEEESEQRSETYEREIDEQRPAAGNLTQSAMGGLLRQEPWVLAVVGIAVGAALGAAFPATAPEKRVLGRAREKVATKLGEISGKAQTQDLG